jgi:hypothetical protein
MEKIENTRCFYYVVANSPHVQASTYTVELEGGAGYPVENNGTYYAAYAVYFSMDKAKEVALNLKNMGNAVKIVESGEQTLYFKSREEKRAKGKIINALDNLYACMLRLQGEIERLERGATQSSSKNKILSIVETMRFLAGANSGIGEYAQTCSVSAERLEGYARGVILAKDLRFELCKWSELYVRTCEIFYL